MPHVLPTRRAPATRPATYVMALSAKAALSLLLLLPLCLCSGCVTEGLEAQGDDDAAPERVDLAVQRNALTAWCGSAKACDDGDLCTSDHCLGGVCSHAPIDGCCNQQSDCDDGKPCTIDTCDLGFHACKSVPDPDPLCCQADEDCGGLSAPACTSHQCLNTRCTPVPKPGCCTTSSDCLVGYPAQFGQCSMPADGQVNSLGGTCSYAQMPKECLDDKDAITACDDKNACTIDYCLNNVCRHTAPKNGCCLTNADCDDDNKATKDTCMNIVAYKGSCSHSWVDGCGCAHDTDCNDGNWCTTDDCDACICKHTQVKNCCLDKFDCDDGNPASADYCVAGYYSDNMGCHHITPPGQCSPKTAAQDCAAFWPVGYTGSCWPHPDGKWWCSLLPFGPSELP